MEVICIKNSIGNYPGAILVVEGSRYNVTNIVPYYYLEGTRNNIWYKLLETGENIHHSSLFALAPPVVEEVLELSESNIVNI